MVRLAMANRTRTFEQLRGPLSTRGIELVHTPARGRTVSLAEPPWPDVDAGFVFPGRLMEGGVLDAVLGVPWLNGREAVVTSRNKAAVLAALGDAGLPVPESVYVSNPVDDEAVAAAVADLGTPVVVKPNSTTRGRGVVKVGDRDSLLGVTDYLDLLHGYAATDDKSYLVQEFLPEARDYRVMVLDGEYVGAVERRPPEGEDRWKHNVHRGAEAVGVDLAAELRRLAERAAAALDVRLLGVDLLVTADRAVVTETNARPTVDDAEKYDASFYDRLAASIRETATRG